MNNAPFFILGNEDRERAFEAGLRARDSEIESLLFAVKALKDDLDKCASYIEKHHLEGNEFFHLKLLTSSDYAERIINYLEAQGVGNE